MVTLCAFLLGLRPVSLGVVPQVCCFHTEATRSTERDGMKAVDPYGQLQLLLPQDILQVSRCYERYSFSLLIRQVAAEPHLQAFPEMVWSVMASNLQIQRSGIAMQNR